MGNAAQAASRFPVRRGVLFLALFAASLVANGCVSVPVGGGSDPDAYNPATGYPAVGGQRWLGWER